MSFFDAPAFQKLAPAVETALNGALAVDPASKAKLKPLNNCVLEIHITSISQSFFFGVKEESICLLPSQTNPSVTLSGSGLALVKLAVIQDKNSLFKRKEVSLTGDAVRAQQIQQVMRRLKIDWEALLAEVIGDVPAHLVNTGLSQSLSWGKSITQSFKQDVEEFVKYEVSLFPNKLSAKNQFDTIDQLRLAADRLEAKVKKIRSSLSKPVTEGSDQ